MRKAPAFQPGDISAVPDLSGLKAASWLNQQLQFGTIALFAQGKTSEQL
jgi:hypothetical protein